MEHGPKRYKKRKDCPDFQKGLQKTERKWWEPPNKMRKMDPASGEYHTRSKTLPKRFYLDHRKSTNKYTQVSK
jgi:hypothetical protein